MTLKHWLITGALAVAAIPAGAELYRWVDASGTVHYSDTPKEGAEQITLRPTNVIRSQSPASTGTSNQSGQRPDEEGAGQGDDEAPVQYTAINITSPAEEETLWNIGGTLTVQIQVVPKLDDGHGVVLYYDGRPVNPEPLVTSSITIDSVYRGQHSVRAAVKDLDGNTVFNGSAVTFFVRQSTGG